MQTAIQPIPRPDLEALFQPRSIAIAGVSSRAGGFAQNMTNGFVAGIRDQGFDGPLYTVNPKLTEFMGLPCFPSLRDIPDERIDYVISGVPATAALDLLDACHAKGVKLVTFFTAGFSETEDADRAALERDIYERARSYGIRLIGPNCMGLYAPRAHVAFMPHFPKEPGGCALISQSGANASEFVHSAGARGVRFSRAVSYGNAIDLTEADLFELAGSDSDTTLVAAYVEGVRDGPRFAHALRAAGLRKPVAVLKGGRTEAGTRAARSHTSSLAGQLRVFDAVCRQAAALRPNSMEELVDICVAFTFLDDAALGPNVGLIGGGGGPTVLAADEVDGAGLKAPPLAESTQRALLEFTPFAGTSVRNPLDTPMFGDPVALRQTLELVAADPGIDLVMYHTGFGGMPGKAPVAAAQQVEEALGPGIAARRASGKPFVFVTRPANTPDALEATLLFQRRAADEGFATFPSVARASRAVGAILERRELLRA